MKILKEAKENLPVSFLTDFISKGWEEVGYLKADIEAIKQSFKGTKKVEELIQGLIDAYLVCIGQLESHIHDKNYIEYPEESGLGLNEELEIKVISDKEVEISSSDEAVITTNANKKDNKLVITTEDSVEDDTDEDEEEIEGNEVEEAPTKDVDAFEYFVDFDEPDMSEPRLTDKDLYDED